VCQSFGISGIGSQGYKLLDIASVKFAIGNPDRKRSALTGSRVSGIQETYARPLDSRSREFLSPSVKRRSHGDCCGCRIPDRELEEP
jgi:hypothetical protein